MIDKGNNAQYLTAVWGTAVFSSFCENISANCERDIEERMLIFAMNLDSILKRKKYEQTLYSMPHGRVDRRTY